MRFACDCKTHHIWANYQFIIRPGLPLAPRFVTWPKARLLIGRIYSWRSIPKRNMRFCTSFYPFLGQLEKLAISNLSAIPSFYFWKTDRFWKLFLQTPKTRERLGSKQKVAFLDFLKNILATDLRCDNRSLMSAMGDRFLRKFLEKNV